MSTVVALIGQAMPTFWLGIMLILVFSVRLNWLPSSGRGDLEHLILPAVTLGLFTTARVTRLTRSGMLEVLGQDYIRTARAKGVSEQPVVWKHALKNASIPIVTIVGIEFGTLLGGSVITETIFAWPGVGRLSVQAIFNRDYPVVQAAVFILASTFVFLNFLVDSPTPGSIRESGSADGAAQRHRRRAAARPSAVEERQWLMTLKRLARRRTALFGLGVVVIVLLGRHSSPRGSRPSTRSSRTSTSA